MNAKDLMRFVLGLDIMKGAGTYAIGGLLMLAGIVCIPLLLVDPLTGGTWIAVGYGLIRGRIATADVQAQIEPPK